MKQRETGNNLPRRGGPNTGRASGMRKSDAQPETHPRRRDNERTKPNARTRKKLAKQRDRDRQRQPAGAPARVGVPLPARVCAGASTASTPLSLASAGRRLSTTRAAAGALCAGVRRATPGPSLNYLQQTDAKNQRKSQGRASTAKQADRTSRANVWGASALHGARIYVTQQIRRPERRIDAARALERRRRHF